MWITRGPLGDRAVMRDDHDGQALLAPELLDGVHHVLAGVGEHAPGDSVEVVVLRRGEERSVDVRLADRPASVSAG
jgi:hypothetical protein